MSKQVRAEVHVAGKLLYWIISFLIIYFNFIILFTFSSYMPSPIS